MRLRIVRPLPKELEGISLANLAFQGSYDLRAPLADLLVASGYAIPEDLPAVLTADSPQRRHASRKRKRSKATATAPDRS